MNNSPSQHHKVLLIEAHFHVLGVRAPENSMVPSLKSLREQPGKHPRKCELHFIQTTEMLRLTQSIKKAEIMRANTAKATKSKWGHKNIQIIK